MAPTHDAQLLKGILPTLVLATLQAEESYGYELVVRLQDGGLTDVSTGTVYPLLARLEREGTITSRLVASSSGPARKYYAPTAVGVARLTQGIAAWRALGDVVDTLIAGEI